MEAYYRHLFKREGWRLVNDAKDPEGAVVLFAEQNGPPLWVRIRSAEDGHGTLVDLRRGGAEEDSAAAEPSPEGPAESAITPVRACLAACPLLRGPEPLS